VENDRHPRTPVAIGGEGVQETGEDRTRYSPGLVNVIKSEEYAVRHPTPASEHAFHLGQQDAPEKELLPKIVLNEAWSTNKAKNYQAPSRRSGISCDQKIASNL
jgi:hypothetical protein